jgi:hypothetical protein
MQAADDSDNDGGDMRLMMMVEGEMKDGVTACLFVFDLNDAASLGLPTLGARRVLSRGAKRAGRYY